MRALAFLCCFLLAFSCSLRADVESTIAYLNEMLASGKKVAIFLVNMNLDIVPLVDNQILMAAAVTDQQRLLRAMAGKDNVYLIDINDDPAKSTFDSLVEQAKLLSHYKLFTMSSDNSSAALVSTGIRREAVTVPVNKPGASGEGFNVPVAKSLDQYLIDEDIDTILVTGCSDSGCVRATAQHYLQKSYEVVVDRDLNVIMDQTLDTDVLSRSVKEQPTTREILRKSQARWRILKEKYPELILVDQSRVPGCEL